MMSGGHLFRSMIIVIAGIIFCAILFIQPVLLPAMDQADESTSVSDSENTGKSVVHLYFSDEENSFLTAEKRVFFNADRPAEFGKIIIEALIEGPRKGLVRTIPTGTKLRALYITQERIAFVDFSDTVKEGDPGGVKSELLTIFSIVNSLVLNMPQVDAVKILINGNESMTLAGHVDLRFPFKANMLLIR
jgi:spore germination protein GerM